MTDNRGETEKSEFKSVGGVGRIAKAIRYSAQGLGHALKHEAAFRQELALVAPFAIAALLLPLPLIEKILIAALAVAVLVVELLNSAIEAVVDRVSLEKHPLSGRAKDLGSAAVFLTISTFVLTWLLLAGPVVWQKVFA
jgi:diacylglycerol kinase (ATP)